MKQDARGEVYRMLLINYSSHCSLFLSALSWGAPPPDPPPPWWIVDPRFLKPKPKTLSLKPKEKANLFEKKRKKRCTDREQNGGISAY